MVLLVQKSIRDRICHAIHRYAKSNNKYMTDYDKNKESWTLKNTATLVIYIDGNFHKSCQ